MVYYKQPVSQGSTQTEATDTLQSLNFAIISNCLVHDAVSVHLFVKKLLEFLTMSIKNLRKVYYFPDGASSHYKNFVNLAFHMRDFNLEAEWHFFATSLGKGPCDSFGGTIKCEEARASLQRPLEGQIRTAFQLYEWAKEAIPSIQFLYVDKVEYEAEEYLLQKHHEAAVNTFVSFVLSSSDRQNLCVRGKALFILP